MAMDAIIMVRASSRVIFAPFLGKEGIDIFKNSIDRPGGRRDCVVRQDIHAAVLHYDSQSGSVPPGTRRQEITYNIPGAESKPEEGGGGSDRPEIE